MKKLVLVLFLFLFCLSFNTPVFAQARFATCDLCGYCPPNSAPQNWQQCRLCIYPGASSDPAAKATLRIDASTNNGPTPYPGHHYTMIGCLTTNLSSFTQAGAAASPIQTLLNIIFTLAGGIAFLYIIYGSFIILTSRADITRLNYGRRVLIGAVVGLLFCLGAIFLVRLIGIQILQIPGFSQ